MIRNRPLSGRDKELLAEEVLTLYGLGVMPVALTGLHALLILFLNGPLKADSMLAIENLQIAVAAGTGIPS